MQEARKLRSFHANAELLKEKLLEEKGRRDKAEAELSKLQEVQFHAEKLENELKMWKSLINEIPGVSSFDDICKKFAALQKYVFAILSDSFIFPLYSISLCSLILLPNF